MTSVMDLLLLFTAIFGVVMSKSFPHEEWGYAETEGDVLGPKDWHKRWEDCGHDRQSPININTSNVVSAIFNPLRMTFDNERGLVTGELENNGHAPQLTIKDGGGGAELTGGPLGDKKFTLLQFHVHFGCTNDIGSEHTLDGKYFSGQLHLVFEGPSTELAVVAVWIKAPAKGNPIFGSLANLMEHIIDVGKTYAVSEEDGIRLMDLLPSNCANVVGNNGNGGNNGGNGNGNNGNGNNGNGNNGNNGNGNNGNGNNGNNGNGNNGNNGNGNNGNDNNGNNGNGNNGNGNNGNNGNGNNGNNGNGNNGNGNNGNGNNGNGNNGNGNNGNGNNGNNGNGNNGNNGNGNNGNNGNGNNGNGNNGNGNNGNNGNGNNGNGKNGNGNNGNNGNGNNGNNGNGNNGKGNNNNKKGDGSLIFDCYYNYEGSLTTPHCDERVHWIVLKEYLLASNDQLNKFRKLKAEHGRHPDRMCDNYRPIQPLHGRPVFSVTSKK